MCQKNTTEVLRAVQVSAYILRLNYYGYFKFGIFYDDIPINYCAFIIISAYIYRTRIYRVLMFTNKISRQTARKSNHTLRNHKRNLNNNDVIFADFYLWLHLYLGSYITYILLVLISLIRDFILNWWCFHRNMKHVVHFYRLT